MPQMQVFNHNLIIVPHMIRRENHNALRLSSFFSPDCITKKIKVTLVTNNITIRREEIIHEHMMTSSLLSHGDMESECIGDSSLLKDK